MGFFKNIGAYIDTVDIDDEPKTNKISKININGEDILFNTEARALRAQECDACALVLYCGKRFSEISDDLIINGINVRSTSFHDKRFDMKCLGHERSDNNTVLFVKID